MLIHRWVGCACVILLGTAVALADPSISVPCFADLATTLRDADQQFLARMKPDGLDRYQLDLTLAADGRSYALREQIAYTNTSEQPDQTVWLRVFANEGAAAEPPIRVSDLTCRPIACSTLSDQRSLVVLRLAEPLAPQQVLTIEARLEGTIAQQSAQSSTTLGQLTDSMAAMQGPGSGDYGLLSRGEGIVSLAHFYAEIAAKRGGEWVGPETSPIGDKGTDRLRHVRVDARLPSAMKLVASGTERALGDGHWEVSAPAIRDLTLLASPEYALLARQVGEVEVRAITTHRNQAQLAPTLETATRALISFEARFGPYPYRQLDLVEAPVIGGAGGVEFSGLATVSSALLKENDPLGQLASMFGGDMMAPRESVREMVVAHEVAHQYWHGLVGSDSRQSPVLDEALAQHSALLYFEDRYGLKRAREEGKRQVAMNYRGMRMMGGTDGAADKPAAQFSTGIAYAGLVYGKAPFAFDTLRRELGEQRLSRALRRYADAHRFGMATRADLVAAFARDERKKVERVFARYFDGQHGDADLGATGGGMAGLPQGLPKGLESLLGKKQGMPGLGGDISKLQQVLQGLMGQLK